MAKVIIYTVDYCPYCKKAKKTLDELEVGYEEIDITHNETAKRAELFQQTGIQTVPQIFVDGKFIGGSSDLVEMVEKGEFQKLIA